MKKKILCLLICGTIICLFGCADSKSGNSEKETQALLNSIAEEGVEMVQAPEGCKIVTDSAEFTKVTEDQSYNSETDHNHSMHISYGVTNADDVVLANLTDSHFYYFDEMSDEIGLLCSKPDCAHKSAECNATMFGMYGLAWYQKKLYTVNAAESLVLTAISKDGTDREEILNLLAVGSDEVERTAMGSGTSVTWILHKGYIYYTYEYGTGVTEDTFYLNGSNCVYRMALDGQSEPECIIPLNYNSATSPIVMFQGVGSYVYMNIPNNDAGTGRAGYLYRYNIESRELERIDALGDTVRAYIVNGQQIYYVNETEYTKVYRYHLDNGEKELVATVDEGMQIWNLFIESEHLALDCDFVEMKAPDKGKIYVVNQNGEKVFEVPTVMGPTENGYSAFDKTCGIEDGKIYVVREVIGDLVENNPWGLEDTSYMELQIYPIQ